MDKSHYRLLAVDEDPKVLDAYTTLFRQKQDLMASILALSDMDDEEEEEDLEFELDCSESGQHGFERVRDSLAHEKPYAVVFLDMRMPNGWDGLETAVAIRRVDNHVRIVLVSAYTDYSLKEIRSEIGPRFVFHTKPWDDDELKQLTRLLVSDWGYEQELREMQVQLQSATTEAINANRAKDQFLAAMSHELRTPLTSLLGYGELLQETPLGDDQEQLLNTMLVSGSNLLYLLNDILDLSKITAGKFEVDHVEFNLLETLREVEHIFMVRAEGQGLQFDIVMDREAVEFRHRLLGDGKRIAQILINLVGNAIKFTQDGFVKLTIFSEDEELHFRVDDSGIGMSDEVLGRLFTPFEQADRSISGRFGGTGLGLHISQTLANLMKGKITVESEYGKGSSFDLVVPLLVGSLIEAQVDSDQEQGQMIQLRGKVLVAEDTPELQLLIHRLIEPTGVEVEFADNGQEAFEMAMINNYDLVLMDMQMPVMNGIEATELLRSSMNKTPVVALTANAMKHEQEAFHEAGCNGYLSKPIRRAALIHELSHYMTKVAGNNGEFIDTSAEQQHPAESAQFTPTRMDDFDDELKAFFFERVAVLRKELDEARTGGDRKEMRALVHNIKGSISSFGFMNVFDTAAEAQYKLDQQISEGLDALLDLLDQQLTDILGAQ